MVQATYAWTLSDNRMKWKRNRHPLPQNLLKTARQLLLLRLPDLVIQILWLKRSPDPTEKSVSRSAASTRSQTTHLNKLTLRYVHVFSAGSKFWAQ
ncbi:MAG: hypothetical protein CMM01_09195 [Rhodopirellula sp.]|nr:hypothetical protein [Rhodopirellula sp.]